MADKTGNLKVIKIMDPILCIRCDNAYVADVVMADGRRKKMFYCSRLDCDNWMSARESSQLEVDPPAAA